MLTARTETTMTFTDILTRARANTPGLQWEETRGGYIRCEDGRCPLEAAAGMEAGHLFDAETALGLALPGDHATNYQDIQTASGGVVSYRYAHPGYALALRVTDAADHRRAVSQLEWSDRGAMMLVLGVCVPVCVSVSGATGRVVVARA